MTRSVHGPRRLLLREVLLGRRLGNMAWRIGVVVLAIPLSTALSNPGDRVGKLEILALKRIGQFGRHDKGCADWQITNAEVLQAFSNMQRVRSEVWGMTCQAYSCAYAGQARYNGRLFDIEVNAAGAIVLFDERETLYFIETKKRPYFLSACKSREE